MASTARGCLISLASTEYMLRDSEIDSQLLYELYFWGSP